MARKTGLKSGKTAVHSVTGRVVKKAPKTGRISLKRIKRAVAQVLKEKEDAARKAS